MRKLLLVVVGVFLAISAVAIAKDNEEGRTTVTGCIGCPGGMWICEFNADSVDCTEVLSFPDQVPGGSTGGGTGSNGGTQGGGGSGGGVTPNPNQPPPPPQCTQTPAPACASGKDCPDCNERKKKACDKCRQDFDGLTTAIETSRMNCTTEAKSMATTHCRMGEVPGGSFNSPINGMLGQNYPDQSVILVGDNYAAAHNCYAQNGNQWHRTCPWAFERQTCDVTIMGNTECTLTDEWMDCINAWLGGHAGFFATFDVSASATWKNPVGVEVTLNGEYAGTMSWAPSLGALGFCNMRAGTQRKHRDKKKDECVAKVNKDFKGGPQCAI